MVCSASWLNSALSEREFVMHLNVVVARDDKDLLDIPAPASVFRSETR
jgi:hypothetical protein